MTINDTTPDLAWLDTAEAELAAEQAVSGREDEVFATALAKDVNEALAKLGITPVTPARSDGQGRLVPALLVPADPGQRFYGVYASFDEESGDIELLVEDYLAEPHRNIYGLHLSVERLTGVRDVMRARRSGPKPAPVKPPQLSPDTRAIVAALDEVRAALDSIARCASRP
jgi:hypothetical protein